MVSSGEVNNDGAGWGWTGMEIAQAVPSSHRRLNNSLDETECWKSILFAHPVPEGDIRRAGNRGAGTGRAGWGVELPHGGTITPALGLKPRPGSVLPPLEGNISPAQPAPSPPFQSGNSQCIPSKNTERSQTNRNPH